MRTEQTIKTKLTQQVGQAPDSIDCPDDLEGKVGATMRCTLKAGTDSIGVTVTVKEVNGTTVNFDIKGAGDRPGFHSAADVLPAGVGSPLGS